MHRLASSSPRESTASANNYDIPLDELRSLQAIFDNNGELSESDFVRAFRSVMGTALLVFFLLVALLRWCG